MHAIFQIVLFVQFPIHAIIAPKDWELIKMEHVLPVLILDVQIAQPNIISVYYVMNHLV